MKSKKSQILPRIELKEVKNIEGMFVKFDKINPVTIPKDKNCAAIVSQGEITGIFYSNKNGYNGAYLQKKSSIGKYGHGIFFIYSTE